MHCIYRKCASCGVGGLDEYITEENKNKVVTWKVWDLVPEVENTEEESVESTAPRKDVPNRRTKSDTCEEKSKGKEKAKNEKSLCFKYALSIL